MRARYALGKSISGILFAGLAATGCTTAAKAPTPSTRTSSIVKPTAAKVTYNYTARDRDCLKRAMYFESEHADRDGYMAVGTVVMNRLTSPAYPDTICEVVAQERQFAPGVMTRTVDATAGPELDSAVDGILRGQRHPGVQNAMFFHTEGLKFPYRNMHYVVEAGGNVFYEKRGRDGALQTPAPLPAYEVAMNYVSDPRLSGSVQFAGVQPFTTSAQIDVLLPEKGPIPEAMPDVAATLAPDSTTTSAIPAAAPAAPDIVMPPEGAPIALPTPRPAYNSAGLASGHLPTGG
ncbi:cell wall hydrolase [Rhizobium sullae]|uniref:Cell wall hydrolase n=1 Tax=Rhizobium sullae TaxID=50338 RepID=A0A2N0D2B7_RHISU|nr:cell wall hydrolase [Rhizobium sullae]PKA40236.1 cell wall hydrolase [Rhizobium sullae]UWU15034.1 cell wall hydrolase [Rhizobium sullae]